MQQVRHAQLFQQAGAVVAGRAVHRQTHRHAQRKHLRDTRHTAGELHVADGAVCHAGAGLRQQAQLLVVEVDAVGEPHVVAQPAQPRHVLQRADALPLQHEVLLILRLAQVGVEPHTVLPRQERALPQQLRRHGEGGAGSQSYAVHGTVAVVVVFLNAADAVRHDLVHRLHHAVRRQPAVLFAEIHAAPAGVHPDTQRVGGGKLAFQQVAAVGGKNVVMVEAGGAAMLHQLPHTGEAGQAHHVPVQIFPYLVQRPQPVEQLHALHLRQIPGEHLIQVVVGVHQTGIAQHMAAVDGLVSGDVQSCANGFDEAVFAVEVNVLQDAVTVVAGDQLGDIPNEQGGHGDSSLTDGGWIEKKSRPQSDLLFSMQGQRSSRK